MYKVNGIKAIKKRVARERDEARVEAEVDEDDSAISAESCGQIVLHTPRAICEQQALYERYQEQNHAQQYMKGDRKVDMTGST